MLFAMSPTFGCRRPLICVSYELLAYLRLEVTIFVQQRPLLPHPASRLRQFQSPYSLKRVRTFSASDVAHGPGESTLDFGDSVA